MLKAILFMAMALGHPQTPDTLDVASVSAERHHSMSASTPAKWMGAEEISRSGAKGLHEVLRSFPGVSVKDYGGIGGLKTVSLRGLGSQHTAVCYDGVMVSDAQNGQVDISRFNLENVSEIGVEIASSDEIFRPARAATASGILSINTISPKAGDKLQAGMRFASFGTYNPYICTRARIGGAGRQSGRAKLGQYESTRARIGGAGRQSGRARMQPDAGTPERIGEGWHISANANVLLSKGVYPFTLANGNTVIEEKRLNSDVQTLSGEVALGGGTTTGGRIDAKINYFSSERGLPGSVVYYSQNPTERLWDRNLMATASYDRENGAWRFKSIGSYTMAWNRYEDSSALYPTPLDDRYTQHEGALSLIARRRFARHFQLVLAEDLVFNSLDSNVPECPLPSRIGSVTALTGQYERARLRVTAGVATTFMHEWVQAGTPAPDRMRLSPSLSASFMVSPLLALRASVRDGFRVPTFNELYYARVGNRSLRPEKAIQHNLGATFHKEFRRAQLSVTADLYANKVKDKIVAVPTLFIWKMSNVGKVRMLGAELSAAAAAEAADWLSIHLNAGYSCQQALDVTDPESQYYKSQIQYVPLHSGNVLASFGLPWLTLSYTMVAVGDRYFLKQNLPENLVEGYLDHSISLQRSFTLKKCSLELAAEALNLSGKNYEVVRFYPMPGRNYRITLKIKI